METENRKHNAKTDVLRSNLDQLEEALLLSGYKKDENLFTDEKTGLTIKFNESNLVLKSKKGTHLVYIRPAILSVGGLRNLIETSMV